MATEESTHNINKYQNTAFTSLFSGFGENAHINIELGNPGLANFLIPLIIIALITIVILLAGKVSVALIQRYTLLEKHKFRLLIILLIILSTFPFHFVLTTLFIIFLIYCFSLYLVKTKPHIFKTHKHFLTASLFLIIFLGFSMQVKLFKNISTEIYNQENSTALGFFDKFGKRFSEDFVYKKEIGHVNSLLKVDLFERSPTSKVIIGKNGMMFEGTGERRIEGDKVAFFDNVSDYLGRLPFDDGELEKWEQVIQQRKCWLSNQGVKYLFTIAPTKALVYPEYLPKKLVAIKSKSATPPRIELLEKQLKKNNNLPVLNLTHALKHAKLLQQYPKLFYRTDFHWNYLGAYYAYQAIIEQVSPMYPNENIHAIELDQFDLDINQQWAHKAFLSLLGLLPNWYNNEHYIKLMPKSGNPMQGMTPYGTEGVFDIKIPRRIITSESGKDYSVEVIENPSGNLEKILVLGDSFIQKVFPLISAHGQKNYFSRAIFHFPDQLIQTLNPDIVIQEILNMYLLRKPPTNSKVVQNAMCN